MIKPRERIIANERMPTWLKLGEQVEIDDCVSRFGEYKEPEHKPKKGGGDVPWWIKRLDVPQTKISNTFQQVPHGLPKVTMSHHSLMYCVLLER